MEIGIDKHLAVAYKNAEKHKNQYISAKARINELKAELLNLKNEMTFHHNAHKNLHTNLTSVVVDESNLDVKLHIKNICKCPIEKCRGYINNEYTCGLCNVKLCNECMVPIIRPDNINIDSEELDKIMTELKYSHDHKCDEDDIKSVKAIMEMSKPCPSCGERINKASGCAVMFCTNCKSGFNWNTMAIIKTTSGMHNPHYFEWINANGGRANQPERISDIRDSIDIDRLAEVTANVDLSRYLIHQYVTLYDTYTSEFVRFYIKPSELNAYICI